MSDFLISLSQNPLAKKIIKASKLPIPLPPVLIRAKAAWSDDLLKNLRVIISSDAVHADLSETQATLMTPQLDGPADAAVYDARLMGDGSDLKELFHFFKQALPKLVSGSRIVVLSAIPQASLSPPKAALQESLTGYIKSLAKELGPKGIAVNLLQMNDEATVVGALRFFLSKFSVFVTGQAITVGRALDQGSHFESLLKERTILITGASRGIGAEIAKCAAREGAKLLLLDHPSSSLQLDQIAIQTKGTAILVDLNDPDSTAGLIKKLWEYAPIHGVVHNAGVTRDKTFARMKSEQWELVQRVNLEAPKGKDMAASGASSSPTAISREPPPMSNTRRRPLDHPSHRRTARNVIAASSSPERTRKSISCLRFNSSRISLPFLESRIAEVAKANISSVLNS
jgi:3-oxoacyl-[acyl-carrier protein] reductase